MLGSGCGAGWHGGLGLGWSGRRRGAALFRSAWRPASRRALRFRILRRRCLGCGLHGLGVRRNIEGLAQQLVEVGCGLDRGEAAAHGLRHASETRRPAARSSRRPAPSALHWDRGVQLLRLAANVRGAIVARAGNDDRGNGRVLRLARSRERRLQRAEDRARGPPSAAPGSTPCQGPRPRFRPAAETQARPCLRISWRGSSRTPRRQARLARPSGSRQRATAVFTASILRFWPSLALICAVASRIRIALLSAAAQPCADKHEQRSRREKLQALSALPFPFPVFAYRRAKRGEPIQNLNCSARMRSSSACPGSNSNFKLNSALLANLDGNYIAEFGVIGNGAHRALIGFQHIDFDLRLIGQQGAAPAPGPERADRGQARADEPSRAISGRRRKDCRRCCRRAWRRERRRR